MVDPSFNSSSNNVYFDCPKSLGSRIIYTTFSLVNILLLFPLYIFILTLGFQRWRRQPSGSTRKTMSHSDFFTYHMTVVEIFSVFGSFFYTLGTYIHHNVLVTLGVYTFSIIFPGQTLFHLLACAERYVAVVHPVAYMRLRDAYAVTFRNVSTACAWIISFVWLEATKFYWPDFPTVPFMCFLGVSLSVNSVFCVSVLCVLTRPGPGESAGRRDPSKQRAFCMIKHITAVLLLRFVGLLLCFGIEEMVVVRWEDICILMDSGLWMTVPSSLVLPLLFLHRAGKISCCKRSTESG